MPNVIISPTGTQGPRGTGWLSGSGAPADSLGIDGDFYADVADPNAPVYYGPKTSNTWTGHGPYTFAVGGVNSIEAADTSIVVGGTASAPTLHTGTLDVIATDQPPAANWSNNNHKITDVAAGAAAGEVVIYEQLPASLPPSGNAGGDLSGTYPDPSVAKVNGTTVPAAPAVGQVLAATSGTAAAWQDADLGAWIFNVQTAGAKGDGQVVTDGAMASGSTTLTSVTASFAAGDVGKLILVKGAGASGVTSLVTTISTVNSATSVTLASANASGGAVSGALVMWATDDTAAFQTTLNDATAYAVAHGAAKVFIPAPADLFYGIGGPLVSGGSTLGNAQLTLPVVATTGDKAVLLIEGPADGAAVQHWQQTVPQTSGATLVSFGVFASSSAQIASINASGNACVIGGPSQPGGYGVAPGVFSNMHVTLKNCSILTTHSANGLTYSAVDLSGVANAALENFAYGTTGTVAGGDYASPGSFAFGLCPGLLMPASGNNDLVMIRNVTCHGGYTYGGFVTEHADVVGMRILYCWASFCPVGTYYGSVGSTHAIVATLLSIESCTYLVYIIGGGSSGIGPFIHLRIDTETSTPRFGDNNSGFASATARGDVVLTGLYTPANLTLDNPVSYDIADGQRSYPSIAVSTAYTVSTFDELVTVDASAAARAITLPTAVGRTKRIVVVKTDASGNQVTVGTTGGQTINGAATHVLATQWASAEYLPAPDGNWIAR